MPENPPQNLLDAFGNVSHCIQIHLSNLTQSFNRYSPSLNQGGTSHTLQLEEAPSSGASYNLQSAETQKKVKASGPTTKEELGRATWTFLHTLAAQYPDKPTRQQKNDVKELMAILSRMYPCRQCAEHFKEVLRATPVQAGSHDDFSHWLCHVHNVVNRSLGKLAFPCERVDARWGKLECEHRACDLQGDNMSFRDDTQ